jgi:hypothetical protein
MNNFIRFASVLGLSAGLSLATVFGQLPLNAAERVVLRYLGHERSIAVSELSDLAETGTVSPALRAHLRLAGRDPETLRDGLNREVEVNQVFLDRALNNPLGNVVVDEVSKSIHTRSRRGDRQAMRAALVLSAAGDDRIRLIEVIENYPTEAVYVEGDRLIDGYNQLARLQRQWERIQDNIGWF